MRAFILLVAIVALSSSASAMMNCSNIAMPSNNFYRPASNCVGDAVFQACIGTYDTCSALAANSGCALGVSACFTPALRCFEAAMPKTTECNAWAGQLNNEKLYLAAGGDYNGSSLDASCKLAACAFANATGAHSTCISTAVAACVDPMFNPAPTRPATAALVTFHLSGTKAMYDALLADPVQYAALVALVKTMLAAILGVTAAEIFFSVPLTTASASLVIVFYTTAAIDANQMRQKMVDAQANPPAGLFTALSALTGETVGIESFSVEPPTGTTLPPLTPTPTVVDTPTPSTGAASATIVAAVLALVCLAL